MIFDVCAYLGNFGYFWPVKVTTAEELICLMDKFGIDRAAICSLNSIFYDHMEGNEEIVKATKRYPSRFVGIATLYPHYRRSLVEFEKCIDEYGMKGLELQPHYHHYELNDEIIDPFLKAAIKRKVPVFIPLCISMNFNFPRIKMEDVYKLIDTYPEATCIVGKFSYEIEKISRLMKKNDNVLAETSGLHLMHGIERLVREVGADRLLFGSGMPIQEVGPGLAKIQEAEIKEEEKRLILGENAIRLFDRPLQSLNTK
jgi:hypothetical protein